jgi:hypothetical protein
MLGLSPPFSFSGTDLFFGIGFGCLILLVMFLVLLGRKYFTGNHGLPGWSFRRAGILLTSLGVALLMGLAASRLIFEFLKRHSSPLASLSTFALLGVVLTLFFCNMILLFSFVFQSKPGADAGWQEAGRKKFLSFLGQPWVASLLVAIGFFLLYLLVFRPGYETDDDISIIMMASGYLGGEPVPFLFFSNVLLGFLLKPLYGLHSSINWEIWFFVALNFISVWALTGLLYSRSSKTSVRLFGAIIVLLSDSYFLLHINFTTIAAFASLAGLISILAAVPSRMPFRKGLFAAGTFLVLAGSLIRIESLLFVLVLTLPAIVLCYRSFNIRNLLIALTAAGFLVASCTLFDRLYLRASPEWYSYQVYNQTRALLHDTPRLENMDVAAQAIGWSENDLLVFRHWFFADPVTYSLENLQTIVAQVPEKHSGFMAGLTLLLGRLASLDSIPYLLVILSTWLGALRYRSSGKAIAPIFATVVVCILISGYLAWTQKLPYRVFLPMLACCGVFQLFILGWFAGRETELQPAPRRDARFPHIGRISLILSLVAATGLVLNQAILTTSANIRHQRVYQQMLTDLNDLQESGEIPVNALIISPKGIPLEWSNLFFLDLPRIQYLDLGWLTFSPPYEAVIRQFDISSLPAALYQKDNVYLMARPEMMQAILVFIQEHEGVAVKVEAVFVFPEAATSIPDGAILYKLMPGK